MRFCREWAKYVLPVCRGSRDGYCWKIVLSFFCNKSYCQQEMRELGEGGFDYRRAFVYFIWAFMHADCMSSVPALGLSLYLKLAGMDLLQLTILVGRRYF